MLNRPVKRAGKFKTACKGFKKDLQANRKIFIFSITSDDIRYYLFWVRFDLVRVVTPKKLYGQRRK